MSRENARKLVVSVLVFGLAFPARGDCDWNWSRLNPFSQANAFYTLTQTFKAFFYPTIGLVQLGHGTYQTIRTEGILHAWKVPFRIARKDAPAILGFLLLTLSSKGALMAQVELDDETKEFTEGGDPDGPIVFVDAAGDDNRHRGLAKARMKAIYGDRKSVIFIQPKDRHELADELRRIAREHGQIQKMEISGHGSPGHLKIGESSLWNDNVEAFPQMTGVFAPDAKVRLRSCETGNGMIGQAFMERFGRKLFDRGGKIYASRVYTADSPYQMALAQVGVDTPVMKIIQHFEIANLKPTSNFTALILKDPKAEGYWPLTDRVRVVTVPSR